MLSSITKPSVLLSIALHQSVLEPSKRRSPLAVEEINQSLSSTIFPKPNDSHSAPFRQFVE
jgi:hypothetical protein